LNHEEHEEHEEKRKINRFSPDQPNRLELTARVVASALPRAQIARNAPFVFFVFFVVQSFRSIIASWIPTAPAPIPSSI
jgi:hypothetical protein